MAELYSAISQYVNQTTLGCVVMEKDIEASRLSVASSRHGDVFEIPISNLGDSTSRLTLSDIEEGDQLQLLMRPDGSISGCDLVFKPATATPQGPNLLVLTSDSTAELVPISMLPGFMQSIPNHGNIQVFSRNGKILILKSGSNIFRLRPGVSKNTLYISYIDSDQIYLSKDQNDRSYSYIISPNDLKRYNQAWTVSDLEIGDRVILKIERGSSRFRLGLDKTQVIEYENRYSIRVCDYPEGFVSKDELGEAMGIFQSGIRKPKALHTHGVVRALLCNRNIIRFAKPNHIAQSIPLPPIQAINQPYQSYNSIPNINPTQPSSIPSINHIAVGNMSPHQSYQVPSNQPISPHQSYQVPSNQPISPHQSYQVPSNQPISPYQSYQVPSNQPISPYQSYQVPSNQPISPHHSSIWHPRQNIDEDYIRYSTKDNQILPLDTLSNHFDIDKSKFEEFQSVFTHSRLFINDSFGLLKAIAVGYLDHICRKSSPPQLLNEFISKLESRTGTYSLTLQSEEGRNIVVEYLKLLSNNRSYDNLEDNYKHSEFMYYFISELKNLTYNKMIEMNASQDLIHKFVYKNEYEPKELLKYFGNALGNLVITHSTHRTKGHNIPVEKYSFVINLIVKSQKKLALLYYRYQIEEDKNLRPEYDPFKCRVCMQLPHITYFQILNARTCQRCHKITATKPVPKHILNMPKQHYSLRNNELALQEDQIVYDSKDSFSHNNPGQYPHHNTVGNTYTTHTIKCNMCCEQLHPSNSVQLECSDIYCRTCLSNHIRGHNITASGMVCVRCMFCNKLISPRIVNEFRK